MMRFEISMANQTVGSDRDFRLFRFCLSWCLGVLVVFHCLLSPTVEAAFEHSHAQWDALTKKHVIWLPGGHASQVDYSGFKVDRQE
ncbi:MAG: hypothetical protein ACREVF_06585, partial [Burkholderiales bacterium]